MLTCIQHKQLQESTQKNQFYIVSLISIRVPDKLIIEFISYAYIDNKGGKKKDEDDLEFKVSREVEEGPAILTRPVNPTRN